MSLEPVEIALALLAALSEGQRTIAHLVILLAVPVVIGLVFAVRRVRRRAQIRETQRIPEDE